ncbi:MAG: hypothetical protein EOM21_13050 [Gammaproteobacteria bacterium]|nr:hypothetical protein [Gammaproteobacteria bacterium]
MHASIATAISRGFNRQVRKKIEDFDPERLMAGERPGRRGPWLRHLRRGLDRIPGLCVVYESLQGEGKRAKLSIVLMDYVNAPAPYWSAFALTLNARHKSAEGCGVPIKITAHALQRAMQRLDVTDPQTALRLLWSAVHAVLWVGPPGNEHAERLFPVLKIGARLPDGAYQTSLLGAAVMVPDRENSGVWSMVTFVDADKLRPEQTAEVRACAKWVSDAAHASMTAGAAAVEEAA